MADISRLSIHLNVELAAGELELVVGGEVPAVAGQVGVARGPELAHHRVQAHPEHAGVQPQLEHGTWGRYSICTDKRDLNEGQNEGL